MAKKPTVTLIEKPIKRLEITAPDDIEEIVVNGQVVWAQWDEEEYKYIPPAMRSFISKHAKYLDLDDDIVTADLAIEGVEVSLYFSTSGRRAIHARFDLILNPHEKDILKVLDRYDPKIVDKHIKVLQNAWDKMVAEIQKTGYEFWFSHDGGWGYDAWWDVVFRSRQWDEEKFMACVRAVKEFTLTRQQAEEEHWIDL